MKDFFAIPSLQEAYSPILQSIVERQRTVVYALAHTQKAHIPTLTGRRFVYVTAEPQCAAVTTTLTQLGCRTLTIPSPFDTVVHRMQANLGNVSMRLTGLLALARGDYDALVVSPKALMQYVPAKARLLANTLVISVGDTWQLTALTDKLAAMGYTRLSERAESKGTFSVMGEVLEVFPLQSEMPVRVLFDFDEVASIKYFQPETMQGMGRCERLEVIPATDMLYDLSPKDVMRRVVAGRSPLQSAKAQIRTDEILSEVEMQLGTNPLDAALQWILPFVKEQFDTLFDYLPPDCLFVLDEPKQIFELLNTETQTLRARVDRLVPEGEALRRHADSLLIADEVMRRIGAFTMLGFSGIPDGQVDVAQGQFILHGTNLPAYCKDINLLVKDLAEYRRRHYAVRLYCGTPEWVNAMTAMLGDVEAQLLPTRLDRGFILPLAKCVVVGTADMCLTTVPTLTNLPSERVVAPKVGDYVVHDEYGIGQCMGVQHIKSYVGEMDYLVLRYAGENKIYVPMHQLSLLKLYAGSESSPKLSNPNKDEFKQQKAKARAGIRKLAFDLLELYAKREQSHGYAYPPDTPFQRQFEAAFEFEETPDQLAAIAEIKQDMESGKVMDRLICGDVGFGKTEVALRAVFKTVMDNKQAAILAPTTILAEQHFMTVAARLLPFGVKVACLSRFRSAKESREILKGLREGTVSVVVGTHRLLSKDVEFFDLGLLVLDEEQRFGVEHKEKIKTMRNNVNVLSLSATPIPRTLHMALSGIRDVSVLDTPPKGRRDVETMVGEYSDALLEDAVRAEINRGGQVFILYNSVEKIYYCLHRLQQMLPDVTFVVGHGQMSAHELEGNIYRFYNKEAQVLLATTIIENGIDVPNANTLFVLEANRLGLAQMYQLKGRVGRSTRQARAYFTYPEGYVPTGDVAKRFDALCDNAGLGSGYRLALMDLEIRGAGDVLGREQHGHVERIGYDMYCRLLRETIALLKGEVVAPDTNTEVSVNCDAYIPDTYVTVERERLKLYRRIAGLRDEAEKDAIAADIAELYGKPPVYVLNLLSVSLLRVLGSRAGVQKIEIDGRFCRVRFVSRDYVNSVAVQAAVRRIGDECQTIWLDTALELVSIRPTIAYKMQLTTRFLRYICGKYSQ
jgi:transcription-repair coupling factor (superfamily II helicase)